MPPPASHIENRTGCDRGRPARRRRRPDLHHRRTAELRAAHDQRVHLHHPHAAFDQTHRHQAAARGAARIDPKTAKVVATIAVDAAGGGVVAVGHGSIWGNATPLALWRLDPVLIATTRPD
jgi:hypothetical protein